MLCFLNILLFLQFTLSRQGPLTSGATVTLSRECPTCTGNVAHRTPLPRYRSADLSMSVLALGEPCGVYTLSCTRGLRCVPSENDLRPLQALLDGRGICSDSHPATRIHAVDPVTNEVPENTPCRKLLITIMKGLESQLFQFFHDIYVPNCDKHGFFKKKQCRSSKGMQRGGCWCVDENGILIPSYAKPDGNLTCDGS